METPLTSGERLGVPERVILAPAAGRFRPLPEDTAPPAGDELDKELAKEQVIGFIDTVGHSTPVRSPFRGLLMGLLAHAGERVREGQPVAWLRTG